MDLKTLKTFHRIVRYGSFHRAAEEMNYAQSTVTMQIQKLETDLGMQLIERGKKIRLTDAGRLFYDQSMDIVQRIDRMQTDLSDMQLGVSGHIRLGVTEPTASYRLPDILGRFLSEYAKVRISLDIANTPVLSHRLLGGELDMALCSAPHLGSELYFEPLFTEEFAVLMPDNHPLADKAVIAPEDFRGYRLLITSATCPYRKKLELLLQESGNIQLDTMEIGSMTALKHYVQSGLGITLVPRIVLNPVPPGTIVRMMSGSLINMTFGIVCKASDYPLKLASAKLYQFLKQELNENPK
ncbi:LysR family transcriptional regulator [Paenibacillus filicis]|uniref:LysR family transcriptional regulator n=1 Tax=Paenibacillus gyeongsangnamensis TaxID=3388067 RepID=A0ABT4QC70_9BACL|nr:LysR family transcriptional regulator [Paenibacillus filicis]MCZ8514415.1 LysR family transcriptional regulator [Paenibacillus filicis]